jgi:hypothetical protein
MPQSESSLIGEIKFLILLLTKLSSQGKMRLTIESKLHAFTGLIERLRVESTFTGTGYPEFMGQLVLFINNPVYCPQI